ncbi:MAG: single-stranded-DNA-specific exonuclease RecJ [Bacteroidales bacterium]|nr:single-stranded-DNA-specific exonuclease RecJ [Bacteroidales bacterium]MDD5978609.1 single-stranded-DNA-specific exonuclease RecJ [Bacteroidales bacterium]
MVETRWIIAQDVEQQKVKELSKAIGVDDKLATLLVQRGITTYNEAKDFFRPSLNQLHDPFLMKDMDKAVDRLVKAMKDGEKILIYGDYDVDGTTAVALIYTYLKNLINKKKIEFYIPDRYEEGYGISYKGIDYAADNGFGLVIVLDCGIKAVEKINYANERGVDFIICDHHRPGDEIPQAVAVLDSKRNDCGYPYKELSGCGVGFKLITGLSMRLGRPIEEVYELLDYVAVSIAADIVPITGENRILAFFGLKLLNKKPRPGIEAVLGHANIHRKEEYSSSEMEKQNVLERELTISDLVFLIGPRINAAGRLEKASDSVRLLIATNQNHAEKLAASINDLNVKRREFDNAITEEALSMIDADEKMRNAKSTVIFNENWHKGVIGIVASRLTDSYYRPTIVLTRSGNLITGSARSIKNFDIYDAIDNCSDLLEHFGGHKYAAGLSLKPENLEKFSERFEQYVSEHLDEDELIPELNVDIKMDFSNITPKFVRILKQFAPFGPGNLSPVFLTENVIDSGYSRAVGNKKHLKLTVTQRDNTETVFAGIAFQKGDLFERIHSKEPFSMCYYIEENFWQGKTTLQLNVKDIKFKSN